MSKDKKSKVNPLDEHHKLPEEFISSKKNVCDHIRKASKGKIEENAKIEDDIFKGFTDLKTIEKLIFNSVIDTHDLFVVRLYVVKAELESLKDKFKGFFSTFYTEIGANHLAVQISDKMVHWYDCGMVLVQEYEGSKAAAVFYPQNKDGEACPVFDNTEENRMKICKVIQRYNCEKKYDLKKCNCQHFAKDIFTSLDLQAEFTKMEGPVGYYLQYIIGSNGRNTKKHAFLVDKNGHILKDENKKELIWETHEELDDWTDKNLEKYQTYSPVIKAFHRAFQMREKSILKKGGETYKSERCTKFGMPTTIMRTRNEKEPIDVYEVDSFTSFKISGLSGMSGTSGISNLSKN